MAEPLHVLVVDDEKDLADVVAGLATRPRAAFTRRQLLDAAWGEGWYGDEHVVDVHIAHVRDKLGDEALTPRYIRTVRGIGYGLASP